MRYFLALDGELVPLEDFTAVLPQEERTFQTYIDRTDEIATGRMIPGRFSWGRAQDFPKLESGGTFKVVTEDNIALTCQVVDSDQAQQRSGTVLECRELDAADRNALRRLMDNAR